MMTETRIAFGKHMRTRFAVGYSKTSEFNPRRFTASTKAAIFVFRAPGFAPLAAEAVCSRQ